MRIVKGAHGNIDKHLQGTRVESPGPGACLFPRELGAECPCPVQTEGLYQLYLFAEFLEEALEQGALCCSVGLWRTQPDIRRNKVRVSQPATEPSNCDTLAAACSLLRITQPQLTSISNREPSGLSPALFYPFSLEH